MRARPATTVCARPCRSACPVCRSCGALRARPHRLFVRGMPWHRSRFSAELPSARPVFYLCALRRRRAKPSESAPFTDAARNLPKARPSQTPRETFRKRAPSRPPRKNFQTFWRFGENGEKTGGVCGRLKLNKTKAAPFCGKTAGGSRMAARFQQGGGAWRSNISPVITAI